MKKIKHNVLNAKRHKKEAEIVAEAGNAGVVTIATNMAGRGTDIKLSDEVKKAGGLAIVGTERHDSRRVTDNCVVVPVVRVTLVVPNSMFPWRII